MKCSEIRKRYNSSRQERNFTTIWICCMLWDDHCRRSNLQHCIDLEETGSICCHYLRVFVTVSLFFDYLRAGWGTSSRRPFMPRKASDNGYAGFWCVLLLWRSFALNRINKFFFSDHRIKCNRGGSRPSERSPVLPSDLVLIHNLGQPHYGGPLKAGQRDQRRLWFLERCTKT